MICVFVTFCQLQPSDGMNPCSSANSVKNLSRLEWSAHSLLPSSSINHMSNFIKSVYCIPSNCTSGKVAAKVLGNDWPKRVKSDPPYVYQVSISKENLKKRQHVLPWQQGLSAGSSSWAKPEGRIPSPPQRKSKIFFYYQYRANSQPVYSFVEAVSLG